MNKFNYKSSEIAFYAVLRQQGMLNHWINFDKLKYRNVIKGEDMSGGKVRIDQLKQIASQIGVNYNTLRQSIMVMYQEGWVYKTPNRKSYVLRNWKSIVSMYSKPIKRFRLKANNKQELTQKIALYFTDRTITQQVYKSRASQGLSTHKRILKALQKDSEYSVSVRDIANALGFKSATTGSKKLKELAKENFISIEKRDKYVCELNDYSIAVKVDDSLPKRTFIKDNCVYERLRSNIIVLQKPLSSKQKFANMIFKKAKAMRAIKTNTL